MYDRIESNNVVLIYHACSLYCTFSNNLLIFSDVLILRFNILSKRKLGFVRYNSFWIVYLLYLNEKRMAGLHAFRGK